MAVNRQLGEPAELWDLCAQKKSSDMVEFVLSCTACISLQIFPVNFCRRSEAVHDTSVRVQSLRDGQRRVKHCMRSSSKGEGSVGE